VYDARAGSTLIFPFSLLLGLDRSDEPVKRIQAMASSVGKPESDRIFASVVPRLGRERRLRCEAGSAVAPDALGKRLPRRFQITQEPLDPAQSFPARPA
jgi:hypothetical protein